MNQEKFTLFQGDSREVIKQIPDNSIDSVVTDPPYGLNFMGKYWDTGEVAFDPKFWEEVLRVLKPGGHLLAFSGSRTYHRMACAIEDAGFEIRDQIMWLYGCLDEATEVATEKGVMPYYKTKIGDRVLCYDVEHGEYTYQPILEIVEYDYNDTAFRLVGDFGEQVVSRNHRVIVERDGNEAFQIAETLECEARVPVLESLSALRKALGEPDVVRDQRAAQGVRAWGGHKTAVVRVIPFHYTGKVWCLRVPTGAFVAVRNGVAFPTGNSGFPKSLDVSKAIDKSIGAVGGQGAVKGRSGSVRNAMSGDFAGGEYHEYIPATEAAKQWQGWGTALKPAHEPIVVARKPLVGTVAENVLTHGTGALNIDGCRVATSDKLGGGGEKANTSAKFTNEGWRRPWMEDADALEAHAAKVRANVQKAEALGRWPANVIHDGSDEVLAGFPVVKSRGNKGESKSRGAKKEDVYSGGWVSNNSGEQYNHDPVGTISSAARFFYCAKASKKDRDDGLEGFDHVTAGEMTGGRKDGSPGLKNPRAGAGRTGGGKNFHPTVKPTKLMQYLCRLVTPPGGTILDPFTGSGSTGRGAILEGFRFVGIEREPEYIEIAESRIRAVSNSHSENNTDTVSPHNENNMDTISLL